MTSSPFPMWIFDRRSGALLEANRSVETIYGYTREELLACTLNDICPGEDWGPLLCERQVTWVGPWLQRRKDGTTFDAEVGLLETGEGARVAVVVVLPLREAMV